MSVLQPSLWDNVAMENGFRCLTRLDPEEAIRQFNEALQSGPGDKAVIQKAIEACRYWQPLLQHTSEDAQSSADNLQKMLAAYNNYPFIPQLREFKKNLLRYIVDQMCDGEILNLNEIESIFDLLLDNADHQKAESIILFFIDQHVEKHRLFYLLAQAQWLSRNKGGANRNYIRALLSSPDEEYISRIENARLKELVQTFGPAMAPAYGWLQGILPFVNCKDEISFRNEEHRKALKSYYLLQEAHNALKDNEKKVPIRYRKQLKTEAPDLYEAYFKLLKERK